MAEKLTAKQEAFVKEYLEADKTISIEYVVKGLITTYLRCNKESDKKYSAWLIKRIKPNIKLIGIEKLLDMEELTRLALEKQKDIQRVVRYAQKRRHQKRDDFALTDDEWLEAVEYFNGVCAYCGDSTRKLTYDHFVPFSKGGSFKKDNILPCCGKCNSSKNNNDFKEWFVKQSFYSEDRIREIENFINLRK